MAWMEMKSLHRAALEAELSSIFTYKKQKETALGRASKEFGQLLAELEPRIEKIADQLNLARIEKRVSEYKVDYYKQLENEEKRG